MRATFVLWILLGHFLPAIGAVRAEWIGYLTPAREAGATRFETDLYFAGASAAVGSEIELINLDIANSTVAGQALKQYARVAFLPAPAFDPWHDGAGFGSTPGFESQITLDAFAAPAAVTYVVEDAGPFRVGTFRFDYDGIVLQPGETIRLDVSGRDEGADSRTTSMAVRGADQMTRLVDLQFTSPLGSAVAEFPRPTVIPEPPLAVWLAAVVGAAVCGRRRRSRRPGECAAGKSFSGGTPRPS